MIVGLLAISFDCGDAAKLADLVRSQLDWLEKRQDGILSTREDSDQKLTRVGWAQELDKPARLNRRYLGEARGAQASTCTRGPDTDVRPS